MYIFIYVYLHIHDISIHKVIFRVSSWHSKVASWSGDIHHPAQDKMKIYENHWATPLFRRHLHIYVVFFFWVFSLGFFTIFFVSTSSSQKNEEAEKLCDGMDDLATISGEVLGRSTQHALTHTEIVVESGWFDEFFGFGPFWTFLVPLIMKWSMMSDFDPRYSSISARGKQKKSKFLFLLVIVNSKVWPFEMLAQP